MCLWWVPDSKDVPASKNKVGKNWLRKTTNIHLWPSHAYTCVCTHQHTHIHTHQERSHEIQEMGDVAQERGQAMAQESKPTASSEQICQKTSMLLNISKAPTVLLAKEKHQLTWENLSLLHSEEAPHSLPRSAFVLLHKRILQRPLMLEQPGQHTWPQPSRKALPDTDRESPCFPGLTCNLQWLPGKHS